jgi:anti-sigma B factor antagonist
VEYGGHPGIVVTHDHPGVAVVALKGEHDVYSAPKLSRLLADELAAGWSIVVDLREAEFLDSTTAGALLVADQRATTADRRLVVLLGEGSGVSVQRLFDTARLHTILTVVPTADDALELAGAPLQSEG